MELGLVVTLLFAVWVGLRPRGLSQEELEHQAKVFAWLEEHEKSMLYRVPGASQEAQEAQ